MSALSRESAVASGASACFDGAATGEANIEIATDGGSAFETAEASTLAATSSFSSLGTVSDPSCALLVTSSSSSSTASLLFPGIKPSVAPASTFRAS